MWENIRSEYDRYIFPYLVRLIKRIENGNVDAFDEIHNPNYSKELIVIKELIIENTKLIADDAVYVEKFGRNGLTYPDEVRLAKENIKKYVQTLLDNSYPNSFIDSYSKVDKLFTLKSKSKCLKKVKK